MKEMILIPLILCSTYFYLVSISNDDVYLVPFGISTNYSSGITIDLPDNYYLSKDFVEGIYAAKTCIKKLTGYDKGFYIKVLDQWIKDGKYIYVNSAHLSGKSGSAMIAFAMYFEILKQRLKDYSPTNIDEFTMSAEIDENCNLLPVEHLEKKRKVENYGVKVYDYNFKTLENFISYMTDVEVPEYTKLYFNCWLNPKKETLNIQFDKNYYETYYYQLEALRLYYDGKFYNCEYYFKDKIQELLSKVNKSKIIHLPGISIEKSITLPQNPGKEMLEYCVSTDNECLSFSYIYSVSKGIVKYKCQNPVCKKIEDEIIKLDYLIEENKDKFIAKYLMRKAMNLLKKARNAHAIIDNGIFYAEPTTIKLKKQFNLLNFISENFLILEAVFVCLGLIFAFLHLF